MRLIKGFLIIFTCLLAGEAVSIYMPVPLPGNIIGMIILFTALALGVIKTDDVNAAGKLLLDNLVLLFIPIGAGIMRYFGLLRDELLAVLVVGVIGFLLLFFLSGKLIDLLSLGKEKKNG